MNKKLNYNTKNILFFLLIIYICMQILILGIGKYANNLYFTNASNIEAPIGEIIKGTEIIQELPNMNKIKNIEIKFATYSKEITSKIRVIIENSRKEQLFSTIISGDTVKDNQYYRINTNINNNASPVYLRIEGIDGISGNSLTIWSSKLNNGEEKGYYFNNKRADSKLSLNINSNIFCGNFSNKISKIINVVFFSILFVVFLNKFENTKKFNTLFKHRYYIVGIIFIISVFVFRINTSSFQTYELFLPNNLSSVNQIQIGEYRGIRSDEWGTLTPLQFCQQGNDNNSTSNLLGEDTELSAISGGIPVKNLSIIGKPFLWGFILFGNEIGLSWYCMLKIILLLLFSYKLINILVENRKISIIGSIILAFSPGIQWWYTTNAQFTENVICLEAIIVTLYNIFTKESSKIKYLNAIALFMSMVGFTFVLYPPFQIPLFYLGIAILIGLYFDRKEKIKFTKNNFYLIGIIFLAYSIVVGITVKDMLPEIHKITNTVYPGKRTGTGGKLEINYLFNYIPTFLLPFKEIGYSNSSEVSSYITLFPIPIVVYFFQRKKYTSNILRMLMVFIIVSLIYMFVGFPSVISKILLMNLVTEKRLCVIFAMACNILLVCISKYEIDKEGKRTILYEFFIFIIAIYYIYRNDNNMVQYIGKPGFILITSCILVMIYFINNRKMIFINMLMIISLCCGLTINPINFGTAKISETPFSLAIRQINDSDPGRWITIDDQWISKYILAQGVEEINSLSYPPMLDTWGKVDKDKKYEDIYNRYAHVVVNLNENATEKFTLRSMDTFEVNLSREDLKKLSVKYLVSKTNIEADYDYKLIYEDKLDGINIYKIND